MLLTACAPIDVSKVHAPHEHSASTMEALKKAQSAHDHLDFQTARKIWLQLATQDNAEAQAGLGDLYEVGKGVRQNWTVALKWYRKAAEHGFAPAQNNLGRLYRDGLGVKRDYAAAAELIHKAADQGWGPAQTNLAMLYKNGWGVCQDYAEALHWYRKAAEQGDGQAQNEIGMMYEEGAGVKRDYTEAFFWYSLATDTTKNGFRKYVTSSQISAVEKRLRLWRQTHFTDSEDIIPYSTIKIR